MTAPRVERAAIYTPQPNELLLVRGEVSGRSVDWALAISQVQWAPGSLPFDLTVSGRIVAATFNDQLDLRLLENKRSIDRLLAHLKHHCPDLRAQLGDIFTRCDWEGTVAPKQP